MTHDFMLSWDLHVHPGESTEGRWGDGFAIKDAARRAGVRGFVWKSHVGSTAELSAALGEGEPRVIPSITLNAGVGARQLQEALRNGVRGATADGLLYGQPWGFSLPGIRVPVFVWHGEADVVVPATMGHYLAETIPGCCGRFFPDDGHFSLPYNRLPEILGSALSHP